MVDGDATTYATDGVLLQPGDSPAFEVVNRHGSSAVVLMCEHAGRALPTILGDMGLSAEERARHIAFDIGAEPLARKLSALLDAPLVLQPYSRLVIDCNRPLAAADSIPLISDTTSIPGNRDLPDWQVKARQDEVHTAFHSAATELLDEHGTQHDSILITVHSFTRRLLKDGVERPWDLGLLFHRDARLSHRLMSAMKTRYPQVLTAFNEPYVADDETDYAIPVHGEARGIQHVLLEVRNDLIADESGQEAWAAMLASAIKDAAENTENEKNVA